MPQQEPEPTPVMTFSPSPPCSPAAGPLEVEMNDRVTVADLEENGHEEPAAHELEPATQQDSSGKRKSIDSRTSRKSTQRDRKRFPKGSSSFKLIQDFSLEGTVDWSKVVLTRKPFSFHYDNDDVNRNFRRFLFRDISPLVSASAFIAGGIGVPFLYEVTHWITIHFAFACAAVLFVLAMAFIKVSYFVNEEDSRRFISIKEAIISLISLLCGCLVTFTNIAANNSCFRRESLKRPEKVIQVEIECGYHMEAFLVVHLLINLVTLRLRPSVFTSIILFHLCSYSMGYLIDPPVYSLRWVPHQIFMYWMMGFGSIYLCYHRNEILHRQFSQKVDLERNLRSLVVEKTRVSGLLRSMLTSDLIERIQEGKKVQDEVDNATVYFSDVQSFTAWSSARSPSEVAQMLHSLCLLFDSAASSMDVTKIKTIGDAYWAVAGLPQKTFRHGSTMIQFAMRTVEIAETVASSREGWEQLKVRIGIHSGPCAGAIVGKSSLSYELFGDVNQVCEEIEQNGIPGEIVLSDKTRHILPSEFKTCCEPFNKIALTLSSRSSEKEHQVVLYRIRCNERQRDLIANFNQSGDDETNNGSLRLSGQHSHQSSLSSSYNKKEMAALSSGRGVTPPAVMLRRHSPQSSPRPQSGSVSPSTGAMIPMALPNTALPMEATSELHNASSQNISGCHSGNSGCHSGNDSFAAVELRNSNSSSLNPPSAGELSSSSNPAGNSKSGAPVKPEINISPQPHSLATNKAVASPIRRKESKVSHSLNSIPSHSHLSSRGLSSSDIHEVHPEESDQSASARTAMDSPTRSASPFSSSSPTVRQHTKEFGVAEDSEEFAASSESQVSLLESDRQDFRHHSSVASSEDESSPTTRSQSSNASIASDGRRRERRRSSIQHQDTATLINDIHAGAKENFDKEAYLDRKFCGMFLFFKDPKMERNFAKFGTKHNIPLAIAGRIVLGVMELLCTIMILGERNTSQVFWLSPVLLILCGMLTIASVILKFYIQYPRQELVMLLVSFPLVIVALRLAPLTVVNSGLAYLTALFGMVMCISVSAIRTRARIGLLFLFAIVPVFIVNLLRNHTYGTNPFQLLLIFVGCAFLANIHEEMRLMEFFEHYYGQLVLHNTDKEGAMQQFLLSQMAPPHAIPELLAWFDCRGDASLAVGHHVKNVCVAFLKLLDNHYLLHHGERSPVRNATSPTPSSNHSNNVALATPSPIRSPTSSSKKIVSGDAGKVMEFMINTVAAVDAVLMAEEQYVSKIKTVGDVFLLAGTFEDGSADTTSSTNPASPSSLKTVQQACKGLLRIASRLRQGHALEMVTINMGIHFGSVNTGIIGRERITFDIFGSTVNEASRVLSNACQKPGEVCVSHRFADACFGEGYRCETQEHAATLELAGALPNGLLSIGEMFRTDSGDQEIPFSFVDLHVPRRAYQQQRQHKHRRAKKSRGTQATTKATDNPLIKSGPAAETEQEGPDTRFIKVALQEGKIVAMKGVENGMRVHSLKFYE